METIELESQALALVDEARDLTIATADDFQLADRYLSRNKSMQGEWEEFTRPSCDAAYTAWKAAIAVRDRILNPLKEWERTIKDKMSGWRREQERLRLDAERKANEEARLAAAVEAEQAGENGRADAILDDGAMVPPVILPSVTPAGTKATFRKEWKYVIMDSSLIPREYLLIDTVKIGQVVRAMKEQTKIPGVKPYAEDVVAGRR